MSLQMDIWSCWSHRIASQSFPSTRIFQEAQRHGNEAADKFGKRATHGHCQIER